MMNRPGYTVDPVYEDSSAGQEIVDVQIRQTGHSAVGRDGVYRGWQDDYTSDSQGRSIYDPKNGLDELAESPVVGFNEEEYTAALLESNPEIPKALDYALDHAPQGFIDEYNAAVDAGNLDKIHQMLELMLKEYHEFSPVDEPIEDEPGDDSVAMDDEVSDADFSDAVDGLNNAEAGGTEVAYTFLEAAEQSEDPLYKDFCMATASFHRGEVSSDEAINTIINKYGMKEAARMYKHFMNQ